MVWGCCQNTPGYSGMRPIAIEYSLSSEAATLVATWRVGSAQITDVYTSAAAATYVTSLLPSGRWDVCYIYFTDGEIRSLYLNQDIRPSSTILSLLWNFQEWSINLLTCNNHPLQSIGHNETYIYWTVTRKLSGWIQVEKEMLTDNDKESPGKWEPFKNVQNFRFFLRGQHIHRIWLKHQLMFLTIRISPRHKEKLNTRTKRTQAS